MLCILVNSISLAIYDYQDRDAKGRHNQILDFLGLIFTVVFLIEAIFKILAMGFVVHRYSYLRDGWNVVDFFIVITG